MLPVLGVAYVQLSALWNAFRRGGFKTPMLPNFTIELISGKATPSGAENKVAGKHVASRQLVSNELPVVRGLTYNSLP